MSAERWYFNQADYDRFSAWNWHLPESFVTSGQLADLWRMKGTRRGGGAAVSILPILCLHALGNGPCEWGEWWTLTQRRLAALAGIDRKTVALGMRQLRQAKLVEWEHVPRAEHLGGWKIRYRVRGELCGASPASEKFARISGGIFYNGAWALLPCPSARQLYLTIAAMDAVKDEASYLAEAGGQRPQIKAYNGEHKSSQQYDRDEEAYYEELDHARVYGTDGMCTRYDRTEKNGIAIARAILATRREQDPISLGRLGELCGFSRRTTARALRYLVSPIFGGRQIGKVYHVRAPFIDRGLTFDDNARQQGATWYAPNRFLAKWSWSGAWEQLNGPAQRKTLAKQLWPLHAVATKKRPTTTVSPNLRIAS